MCIRDRYGVASALKDGVKDKLKGMATLGAVRFTTVQTPKSVSYTHLNSSRTNTQI